jgi:hypothetical protein
LGATANKKERNCPRFLSSFSALGAIAARSDDEGTSPILGARVHRDRKQGSEQLLISLLARQDSNLQPDRYERQYIDQLR